MRLILHLLSMLMFIAWKTLLIWEDVAALNPSFSSTYNYPSFYSYFQPASNLNSLQNFGFPYHQHHILGPYRIPPLGPYFPTRPTDMGGISAQVNHVGTERIIGGFPVSEGMTPFMAVYRIPKVNGGASQCGGTLITPKHILTAAHCLESKNSRPIGGTVTINSITTSNIPKTAEVRKVKAFKSHELFKFINLPNNAGQAINGYDIAILTLDKDVTTVKPVALANSDQTPAIVEGYKNAFATGWGRIDPSIDLPSTKLMGTVLKILSNADYQKIKNAILPDIKGTQMSAYYPFGGRGTCLGDSGGPLMVGNQKDGFLQVGITSYGSAQFCGLLSDNPGVFTRVSRFFDWINLNTGGLLE